MRDDAEYHVALGTTLPSPGRTPSAFSQNLGTSTTRLPFFAWAVARKG